MTVVPRPRRRSAALAAATAALLLAASCTGGPTNGDAGAVGTSDNGGAASSDAAGADEKRPPLAQVGTSAAADLPGDPAEDKAYASYYRQNPHWENCKDLKNDVERECATIKVPRAWNDPGKGDIELALARVPATGDAKGSLVLNPGGPGASGVDFVSVASAAVISPEVKSAYDLVSFDPRGVSRSEGVRCVSDDELDAHNDTPVDPDATPEQRLEQAVAWMKKLGDGCEKKYSDLLPYLDTLSAARDMDVVRAVVGSEKLDYLGYSYGTYLGATFAELYPQRVGRFVLDGAMDPTLTLDDINAGQTKAFEEAIGRFLESCVNDESAECPFKGSRDDAGQQLKNLVDQMNRHPLPTGAPDGRKATGTHLASAIILGMYEDGLWQQVRTAITDAMNGDGSAALGLADMSANRNDDGTYDGNSAFAINAVNCLDHPGVTDEAWQKKRSKELEEKFPLMGADNGYGATLCAQWPAGPVRKPAPVRAEGAAPIVVIGTTGDPATPYAWSKGLAEQLSSGRLLTFEGNGHTAYGRSGGCIEKAVDAYLLKGTVPEDDTVCNAPEGSSAPSASDSDG